MPSLVEYYGSVELFALEIRQVLAKVVDLDLMISTYQRLIPIVCYIWLSSCEHELTGDRSYPK